MRRLTLALLLAPATLHAQAQAYDPAPVMAAAIKEALTPNPATLKAIEELRALGLPGTEKLPSREVLERPRKYKVSTTYYPFARPERQPRIDAFVAGVHAALSGGIPRLPPGSTENAALAADIATRLGLETTPDWEIERTCNRIPYPEGSGRTGTYKVCRYAQSDGVVAASLPIISGDTARVDVLTWENQYEATRGISSGEVEVTLVRTNEGWTVVSRKPIGTIRSWTRRSDPTASRSRDGTNRAPRA